LAPQAELPGNGVLGNYNAIQSELAEKVTLQESRLTALPSSMSDSAIMWQRKAQFASANLRLLDNMART
jgi:hypothetical protein